jgi:uncharacterized protein YktB (UPF0637 family)
MEFRGFTEADFDVFAIPGLESRMEALKAHLRPKLEQLGRDVSTYLSELLGTPVYAHVAKHARRTVNPPKDSWVAFCTDKRGYKKHPHFQIGVWPTHAFATFGLIYEAPDRAHFGHHLRAHLDDVLRRIPPDFEWYPDYTRPEAVPTRDMTPERLGQLADRLITKKQGDLLVGIRIPREEALSLAPAAFIERVQSCFSTLIPLYRLATSEVVPL